MAFYREFEMSLHRFFKPLTCLPTAEETGLSASTVEETNKAVEEELGSQRSASARPNKKRKYTTTFTPEVRAQIGRYAAENGNGAAVKKFKATHDVGESTVRAFKKKYLEEVKKQKGEVTKLAVKKRGRKVLLGEELDGMVQKYVQAIRNAGTPIGTSVVMAAAQGIVKANDRTLLFENGGYISITRNWALSLLGRMGYVKRKATTSSTPWMSDEEFQAVKTRFLKQVSSVSKLRSIPESLIINIDQTGVKLVPTSDWTMAASGSKRVEVAGLGDKRKITATFGASLDGTFLPMHVLYQGKTDRSHPKFVFPDGFDVFHTPNHCANEDTCLQFFEKILFPYVDKVREAMEAPDQKALLIMDNFSGQTTDAVLEKLEEKGIVLVMVPANTTDRLQPLDISVNKSAKDFLRDKFRTWYAEQVEKQLQAGVEATAVTVNMGMAVVKELGAKWLTSLYDKLQREKTIIINRFKNVGIVDALKDQTLSSDEDDIDPFENLDSHHEDEA